MGTVNVRIGHNDDPAVAQLRDVKVAFFLAIAILFGLADAGANGGDH